MPLVFEAERPRAALVRCFLVPLKLNRQWRAQRDKPGGNICTRASHPFYVLEATSKSLAVHAHLTTAVRSRDASILSPEEARRIQILVAVNVEADGAKG